MVLMVAGAHAVKLEGVDGHEDVIQRMVQSGIPVMGHLGLQPQSVHAYGGFRVQGRSDDSARNIARQAATLEELGAFAIVLECVPANLAREISESLRIPDHRHWSRRGMRRTDTGASGSAGHEHGFSPEVRPPLPRRRGCVLDALARFDEAVKAGTFPAARRAIHDARLEHSG